MGGGKEGGGRRRVRSDEGVIDSVFPFFLIEGVEIRRFAVTLFATTGEANEKKKSNLANFHFPISFLCVPLPLKLRFLFIFL